VHIRLCHSGSPPVNGFSGIGTVQVICHPVSNLGISPMQVGLRLSERQFIAVEEAARYQNMKNHKPADDRTG
jgi:hypothetical protein